MIAVLVLIFWLLYIAAQALVVMGATNYLHENDLPEMPAFGYISSFMLVLLVQSVAMIWRTNPTLDSKKPD